MEIVKQLACFCLCTCLPTLGFTAPYYGVNFSYAAIATEPPTLHGYQLMLSYDPDYLPWGYFSLYFDGGVSHFWITNNPHHRSLNIYSAAPVIRYNFNQHGLFRAFIDMSIGLSYLTRTRLDKRNLGIHFAFQDRLGVGVLIGHQQQFSLGIHIMHYSNAHLSANNSGITVPLALDIGYRFC